jgi:hypothetical protein
LQSSAKLFPTLWTTGFNLVIQFFQFTTVELAPFLAAVDAAKGLKTNGRAENAIKFIFQMKTWKEVNDYRKTGIPRCGAIGMKLSSRR